jgi:nicotinamidase-related amidase
MPPRHAAPLPDAADEVLGFVLRGRPERLEEGLLVDTAASFRAEVRRTREALVHLACAGRAEAPSVEVRARLVTTVARRLPRRAVLVLDMIHDHLDPGALLEVPRARAIVPSLDRRLATARGAGTPVVYVVDEHDEDDPDLLAWGRHAVRGSPGAAVWRELTPAATDLVVRKPSYSAFFRSELEVVLDRLGVDTLVLTGCLTELGLLATATDAMQRGFVVEVPPDSQAGSSAPAEDAALGVLRVMAPFGRARQSRLGRRAA